MEKTPKLQSEKSEWSTYKVRDTVPSADKGCHKERSIANSPNHLKHWKTIFKWKPKTP